MYTGLTNRQIVDTILDFGNSMSINYWAGWEPRDIEKKEQLVMTLMKMRLYLPHGDLACQFSTSTDQLSNIVIS